MATEQEKATAKAKALKGGMDPAAADKIFQMGSKGEFYMQPGHSNSKSMSELNMSNKDALMMSALLHKADPPGHTHGGSTEFKIDESGATLSNVDTNKSVVTTPKSSSTNIKVVDEGEDAFYNNLISSSKDMNAMVSQGIDPKDKKAVLDYGNKKFEAMSKSSGGGTEIKISQNKDEKKNTNNIAAIESSGQREMDKFIGDINLKNYTTEMNAKRDSVATANKVRMDLIKGTTDRSKQNLDMINAIAGYEGSKSANVTRTEGDIPTVSNTASTRYNQSFLSGSNQRSGNNVDIRVPANSESSTSGSFGSGNVRRSGDVSMYGGKSNQLYNHPVYSSDGKVEYKRDGQLYIDSGAQMKPLKMSYQGSKKK